MAETAREAEPSGPGLLDKVDHATGTLNGWIGSVFFYDVGGKTHTSVADGVADEAQVSVLVDSLFQDASFDVEVAAVQLELPAGTTEDRRAALESALRAAWSAKTGTSVEDSSQSMAVKVAAGPAGAGGKTTLSAKRAGIPLTVLWLILGAVYFTFRMGFINLRGFKHAIQVVQGKYDNPESHGAGEVSHFQALASALSATVGLGNIAGVAIAISLGGPGATFWMIAAGFLGMSSKFVECSLGQKFRQVRPDGRVMGGAMYYLSNGLKEKGLGGLGKFLAVFFAILCIGGSFGGGNTFQVNQSLNALKGSVSFLSPKATPIVESFATAAGPNNWIYGLIMAVLVGIVILGGIQRIAATAEKIVPLMCGVYVLGALYVLFKNTAHIPDALGTIFAGAFSAKAMYGGFLGVLVQGFKRAAFSNEAGVGSAAIAHSAAKTPYPVREGIVALLEPFIDTIVVCTMTALVIVITGAYASPDYAEFRANADGAGLTAAAFSHEMPWFPMVLSAAVMLFAFSTMISWSYYGERCWAYLFGDGSSIIYRLLFLACTFAGSIVTSMNVLEFGDLMILGMAFPNILGVLILSGGVKNDLDDYMGKLKSGEIRQYK
ncbi:MAG: alanine:cation symporter family protein [Planctomycetes bacterium]|nr:alanine:cation symporter family protein [Planctomycetota bacterium]